MTKNLDARLADLGLATQIEEVGTAAAASTRSHGGGTRGYQAPEVATKKFTTKADMYSLCQMYFEMAVGKRPVLEDGVRITPDTLGPLEAKDDKATLSLMQFMLKVDSAERPTAAEAVSRIKLILSRMNLIERGIHVDYQAEQHVVAEQDIVNSKSMSASEWISRRVSPVNRFEAASTCDELVAKAAQPSEAEMLAEFINHPLLDLVAADALLSAKGAVAQLVRVAADEATPAETRVILLDGVLCRTLALSAAAHRDGDALNACLAMLASSDTPPRVRVAASKLLFAKCDDADATRRKEAVARLTLQPGDDVAAAARTLAGIVRRREDIAGFVTFGGAYELAVRLEQTPGQMAMLVWMRRAC